MPGIYLGPDGRGRVDVWIDLIRNEWNEPTHFGVFVRDPLEPETGVLIEETPQYWHAEVLRDHWQQMEL
jgi:hypothetical protein